MLRFITLSLLLIFTQRVCATLEEEILSCMKDGLPQVGLVKFQRALQQNGSKLEPSLLRLSIECCIRARQPKLALELCKKYPNQSDVAFWEGHAYLQLDQSRLAMAAFDKVKDASLKPYAAMGRAEALRMLGAATSARSAFNTLREDANPEVAYHARMVFNELELDINRVDPVLSRLNKESGGKDPTVQLLRARAYLMKGERSKAEAVLRDLLASDGVGERAHDAANLMLTLVLRSTSALKARGLIVSLIDSLPGTGPSPARNSDYLHDSFQLLRELPLETTKEAYLNTVLGWTTVQDPPALKGYALDLAGHVLAAQGRTMEAVGMLEAFLATCPIHARREAVLRRAAQLHGELNHDQRLLALAAQWRKEFGRETDSTAMDVMVANIEFTKAQYSGAMKLYQRVADNETDLPRRRLAIYNAAISALKAEDNSAYQTLLAQLQDSTVNEPQAVDVADLELEEALHMAKQLNPEASQKLKSFLEKNRTHPKRVTAQLALAEMYLLEVPPLTKAALETLDSISTQAQNHELASADALRIWLREAEGDLQAVTRDGLHFVEKWPQSTNCAEALMKVAEAFYRMEDFSNAQTYFSTVVEKYPESSYVETALFFSGKSAMALNTTQSLNEAISRWQEVVKLGGPLTFTARLHQALAKRQQNLLGEALNALDGLLEDKSLNAEQTRLVRFEKAELLISMGSEEKTKLQQAEGLLRSIIASSQPYLWRARAGVLLSKTCLEIGKAAEALEAAYDVLQAANAQGIKTLNPAEHEWHYRAGFMAMDQLEKNQQWEAAACLGERLAESKGSRAKEAQERATRIRLEHFLWDASKPLR
jgi:tetratricopeptide (TPR) repeat protein